MTATTKTRPVPAVKVEPAVADLDTTVAELRKRFTAADNGEATTWAAREAADLAWQNARVVKVRVAYAAAMLTPVPNGPDKGSANLLAATRFLLLTDEERALKPAAIKKLAVARKSTLRNYVAAGEALQEAGLATRITEPDEDERKIVADVFREMNKRDKADDKAAKGEGEGEAPGEGEQEQEQDPASLTFADLVGHVAQMNALLNMMQAGGVVISEREASSMADMLNGFQMKLAEYSEGK